MKGLDVATVHLLKTFVTKLGEQVQFDSLNTDVVYRCIFRRIHDRTE